MSIDRITEVASPDGSNTGIKLIGTSTTHAAPSPDGRYVAAIASRSEIQIYRCPSRNRSTTCYPVSVNSKSAQKALADAELLRWSPEHYLVGPSSPCASSEEGPSIFRSWLLVSNGRRLVVFCIELGLLDMPTVSCTVSVEYDLGDFYGGYPVTEFALSHNYAIVLPSMGLQASILSLSRPERQDVLTVKFGDVRSVAISPKNRCFSILTRSEGQDLVLIFHLTDMDVIKKVAFSSPTLDAQGIKWSPIGEPLLCIWDSASFGVKISFFTANGHHLVQMGLTSDNLHNSSALSNFEGLGVNTLDWISCDSRAILAIFDCSGNLFLRQSSALEKFHSPYLTINHNRLVDGASYQVWHESQNDTHFFTQHTTSFEPRTVKPTARTDQIAINAQGQLLATKHSLTPWTLWIWDACQPAEPVSVLNFRHRIKQLLWHPTNPDILLILTAQKEPLLYVWEASQQQILLTGISAPRSTGGGTADSTSTAATDITAAAATATTTTTTTDWQGKWIGEHDAESISISSSSVFLISCMTRYDLGAINIESDRLVFKSILS